MSPGPKDPLTIGIGWSTEFDRTGWDRLYYRRLRYAYRAPAFFTALMLAGGCQAKFVRFDEGLKAQDLDGTNDRIAETVDVLYIAAHGESPASGYRVALYSSYWTPSLDEFGATGPSVAVFDTCDLIDLRNAAWSAPWVAKAGRTLRLLLGFASPATVAHDSTRRGQAFAESILSGAPIGPSWLQAVNGTGYVGTDVGVAIGFGDDAADAGWALDQLTLADLPARRHSPKTVVQVRASR
jgi:hypothetical protein